MFSDASDDAAAHKALEIIEIKIVRYLYSIKLINVNFTYGLVVQTGSGSVQANPKELSSQFRQKKGG